MPGGWSGGAGEWESGAGKGRRRAVDRHAEGMARRPERGDQELVMCREIVGRGARAQW